MAVYSLLLVSSREVKRLAPGRGAMNQVSAAWPAKSTLLTAKLCTAVYSLLLVSSREVKRLAPGRGAMNEVSAAWPAKSTLLTASSSKMPFRQGTDNLLLQTQCLVATQISAPRVRITSQSCFSATTDHSCVTPLETSCGCYIYFF